MGAAYSPHNHPVDLQPGTRSIGDFAVRQISPPPLDLHKSLGKREGSREIESRPLPNDAESREGRAGNCPPGNVLRPGKKGRRWARKVVPPGGIENEPWTGDLWRTNGRGISCFIYGPMHGRRSTGNMFIPVRRTESTPGWLFAIEFCPPGVAFSRRRRRRRGEEGRKDSSISSSKYPSARRGIPCIPGCWTLGVGRSWFRDVSERGVKATCFLCSSTIFQREKCWRISDLWGKGFEGTIKWWLQLCCVEVESFKKWNWSFQILFDVI